MTRATAEYWVGRWRGCLPPPADAEQRAARLGRDLARYRTLLVDIAAQDQEIEELLAGTDGQILISLPGVAAIRAAAAFAVHSLPISRFPGGWTPTDKLPQTSGLRVAERDQRHGRAERSSSWRNRDGRKSRRRPLVCGTLSRLSVTKRT